MADARDPRLRYAVQISLPGQDLRLWWVIDNNGTPGQVAAAFEELADRVLRDRQLSRDPAASSALAFSFQVDWPDGAHQAMDGCLQPPTLCQALRSEAGLIRSRTEQPHRDHTRPAGLFWHRW